MNETSDETNRMNHTDGTDSGTGNRTHATSGKRGTPPRRAQAAAIAAVIALGAAAGIGIWRSATPAAESAAQAGHGHEHADEHGDEHGGQHAEEPAASVMLDDIQLQQAGIALATAGPARLAERVLLSGEVRYDADRTVQLTARAAGLVESVHVQPGERVRRGQLLAWLSSPAVADLRAASLAAAQRLAAARAAHAREQQLWDERINARQDLEQARSALQEAEIAERGARQKLAGLGAEAGGRDAAGSASLTRLPLRAPAGGTLTERRAAPGQAVAEGEVLFVVSDLSRVWVEAPVPARDLAAVAPGRKVRVQAEGGGPQADAAVGHVSATLDTHSRTATARVPLPNPQGLWRPGLPVQLAVAASDAEVPVAVPAEALHTVDGRTVVFVREGPALSPRPVQAGRRDGALVEVAAGLRAGERVAAANSHVVKAELGKAGAAHEH